MVSEEELLEMVEQYEDYEDLEGPAGPPVLSSYAARAAQAESAAEADMFAGPVLRVVPWLIRRLAPRLARYSSVILSAARYFFRRLGANSTTRGLLRYMPQILKATLTILAQLRIKVTFNVAVKVMAHATARVARSTRYRPRRRPRPPYAQPPYWPRPRYRRPSPRRPLPYGPMRSPMPRPYGPMRSPMPGPFGSIRRPAPWQASSMRPPRRAPYRRLPAGLHTTNGSRPPSWPGASGSASRRRGSFRGF